jgi:hypothetical protein
MVQKVRPGDTVRVDKPFTSSEDRYTGRQFYVLQSKDGKVTVKDERGKSIQFFEGALTRMPRTMRRLDRKPARGRGR